MRVSVRLVSVAALGLVACWRIGEPTESAALVTWAAYPDTVVVGRPFSFEFAGPVTPDACGRLDTAIVEVSDSTIRLSARRSVYETMCAASPVTFYEARPLTLDRAGRYAVVAEDGRELGTLVARAEGRFAPILAIGEGSLRETSGCTLFGPGRIGNQRPFALRDVPAGLVEAAREGRVFVRGRLTGFALCGRFGSRPVIRVDTAWVTDSTRTDWY